MTIHLKHFDTKLAQDLEISEKVENSLAEYLFPETEFAIGAIYKDNVKAEDLGEYDGKTLQFAAGERMYFASSEVRPSVYPNLSDGAAYGSLIFTPCKSFSEVSIRVLVVDDETGANGGMMPTEDAKNLVGDCYGKLSPDLVEKLTGKQNTPFQFRMGIKPQAENDVHRIAKGTFAPANLDNLGEPFIRSGKTQSGELITKTGYDMVVATSSFKGRKGEDAIKPGEYYLTVGVGVKSLANYGEQSLGTQILVNYPKGVQADILPELREKAEKLVQIQSDPRKVAQLYVEKYEKRKAISQGIAPLDANALQEKTELQQDDDENLFSVIDDAFGEGEPKDFEQFEDEARPPDEKEQLLYRLLKADLEAGHGQLLEHPKITDELNKFVRKEWVDIATGRAIKFDSGLAQPSLKLTEDEICIPHFPEGAEVIVTRSPLVNSNGVITLTNKHLPEFQHEQGTVHINPKTAAAHLQADFDGDRLAFQLADKYPTLAAEVKEHNTPKNRYPDIVKAKKIPYVAETFAEIAVLARENKIGIIANQIQKTVALQYETELVPQKEKAEYLQNLSAGFKRLIIEDANPKADLKLPESFKGRIQELINLPKDLTHEQIDAKLAVAKEIFFDVVSELGNELQVAVDGPKSAQRPNEEVLQYCNAISEVRPVGWLKDKRSPEVYFNRTMDSRNHSPIDLMVQQTNEFYEVSSLEARPIHQFQTLLNSAYSPEQEEKARLIKDTYNSYVKRAKALEKKIQTELGPVLTATSAKSGKQIEITNLIEFEHPDVWKEKQLTIRLVENNRPSSKMPHPLIAEAMVKGGENESSQTKWKRLGSVSEDSVQEHNLKAGLVLKDAAIELKAGVDKHQIKAIYKEANHYLAEINAQTPLDQKMAMASAIWQLSHTKSDREDYNTNKKAGVAFNAYPDQVVEQLSTLQFTKLQVVGLHFKETNEHHGRDWDGDKVPIAIALETRADHPNYGKRVIEVEGKQLGAVQKESPSLSIGARAEAVIVTPPSASVTATTAKGNTLKITQVGKYDFADHKFKNEQATITIGFKDNPKPHKPPIPVIQMENQVLGVIDKESANQLLAHNKLKPGVSLAVSLESAPSTFAYLKVDASTVTYPERWTRDKDARVSNLVASVEKSSNSVASVSLKELEEASVTQTQTSQTYPKAEADKQAAVARLVSVVQRVQEEIVASRDNLNTEGLERAIRDAHALNSKDQILNRLEGSSPAPLSTINTLSQDEIDKLTDNIIELSWEVIEEVDSHTMNSESLVDVIECATAIAQGRDIQADDLEFAKALVQFQVSRPQISAPDVSVTATTPKGNTLNITQVQNYQWADRHFNGESAIIKIDIQNHLPIALVEGKVLGVLDEESADKLRKIDLLKPGTGLIASLQTEGAQLSPLNETPEQATNPPNSPDKEATLERPNWERRAITMALKSLEANPSNSTSENQVATFADAKYAALFNTHHQTLQILDATGERGTLYKAQKGQTAEIIRFTENEKASFDSLGRSSTVTSLNKPGIER